MNLPKKLQEKLENHLEECGVTDPEEGANHRYTYNQAFKDIMELEEFKNIITSLCWYADPENEQAGLSARLHLQRWNKMLEEK